MRFLASKLLQLLRPRELTVKERLWTELLTRGTRRHNPQ